MLTAEYLDSLRNVLASVRNVAEPLHSTLIGPVATDAIPKLLDEIDRLREALTKIHELRMARGDGSVGDYISDIREICEQGLGVTK